MDLVKFGLSLVVGASFGHFIAMSQFAGRRGSMAIGFIGLIAFALILVL